MKRCDRFGAFFAAELFLQAALVAGTFFMGSFTASVAHAGIVLPQTETERVALGDRDGFALIVDPDASHGERVYDGEAIADDDGAAATTPAAEDTATDDCGDYLRYKYGHLESFYGDHNFAAGESGAPSAVDNVADNDASKEEEKPAGDEAATQTADNAAKDDANTSGDDGKPAASDDSIAAEEKIGSDDTVADDESSANDKGSEEDETVADIAKATEEAKAAANDKAADDQSADDLAAQEDECHRDKYENIHARRDVADDQSANNSGEQLNDGDKAVADQGKPADETTAANDEETAVTEKAVKAANETPAAEGYSTEKIDEAYGRDYKADGDEESNASNNSKDDANDGASDSESLNSRGCLAICDALLAVFNDAAGQVSSDMHIYYSVVSQISSHNARAK